MDGWKTSYSVPVGAVIFSGAFAVSLGYISGQITIIPKPELRGFREGFSD